MYTCVARNVVGRSYNESKIRVIVKSKSMRTKVESKNDEFELSTLECTHGSKGMLRAGH